MRRGRWRGSVGLGGGLFLFLFLFQAGCGDVPAPPTTAAPNASSPASPMAPRPAAPNPGSRPAPPKAEPVDPQAYAGVPEALDALVAAIKASDNPGVAKAEGWFAQRGASAVEPLVATIRDEQAEIDRRIYACRALAKSGPTAGEPLLELVSIQPELLQLRVIDTLGRIKPTSPTIVARLRQLSTEGELRTRQMALSSLGRIGPDAKEVAPDLQKMLNDPQLDDSLRKEAGKALKSVDPRKGLMGLAP